MRLSNNFSNRSYVLRSRDCSTTVSYTHLDVYKRQVVTGFFRLVVCVGVVGGRGLALGFKVLFGFCMIVSNSTCDLKCSWSFSMLFGCSVWCLYISYCSAVLSFLLFGK